MSEPIPPSYHPYIHHHYGGHHPTSFEGNSSLALQHQLIDKNVSVNDNNNADIQKDIVENHNIIQNECIIPNISIDAINDNNKIPDEINPVAPI